MGYDKPNQKQFKQFDKGLALNYINKFDFQGKVEFFKLVVDVLSEDDNANLIALIRVIHKKLPDSSRFKDHLDKWFEL